MQDEKLFDDIEPERVEVDSDQNSSEELLNYQKTAVLNDLEIPYSDADDVSQASVSDDHLLIEELHLMVSELNSQVESLTDLFERRIREDVHRADMYATIQQQVKQLTNNLFQRDKDQLYKELLSAIDGFLRVDPLTADLAEAGVDQIMEVLARRGVSPIKTEGLFDPQLHVAVEKIKSSGDLAQGSIVRVHTRGYMIGDRVLQPARVVIMGDGLASEVGNQLSNKLEDK